MSDDRCNIVRVNFVRRKNKWGCSVNQKINNNHQHCIVHRGAVQRCLSTQWHPSKFFGGWYSRRHINTRKVDPSIFYSFIQSLHSLVFRYSTQLQCLNYANVKVSEDGMRSWFIWITMFVLVGGCGCGAGCEGEVCKCEDTCSCKCDCKSCTRE